MITCLLSNGKEECAFHDRVPVHIGKMAANMETTENKNSIAITLLRVTQRVDYCRTIKPLKLTEAVMIADFGKMELATLFELDSSKCFTGKKKSKFNKYCIYDIFAAYCRLDKFVLKDMVNKEITDNLAWYTKSIQYVPRMEKHQLIHVVEKTSLQMYNTGQVMPVCS